MAAPAREVVEQILRAGRDLDAETLLALMASDGYIEWPYRPAGVPARLRGHAEIRAYLASAAKAPIRWNEFVDVVMHETVDPEVVIVEYEGHGTVTTTGAPYLQNVIAVFRVRAGRIISWRDYFNPLALAAARVDASAPS
ncbi:nuclear transport factor 2 family protein [Frankia sp. AgB32]|uniref:nuclear transport factor 2 family protein n=1 Tax=Frankia sp. AgB32 TaxID=631119 RepID=UPI00200EBA02|nr:nuclear transport factor 2 family protein [Frankia sp. AgB32]MCK9895797.1 nuclear transport factor 2 family protein [Frankia sp. AgB32]